MSETLTATPEKTSGTPAHTTKDKVLGFFRRNLSFLVFLLVAFAFRWSFADQYLVPSGSMEPTIEVGDRILVNKMAFDFKIPYTSFVVAHTGEPQRGDIVVFENPRDGVTMVKRVIGLPGDKLEIDDGFVKINGQPIEGDIEGIEELSHAGEAPMTYHEHFNTKEVTIKRLPFMMRPHHFELSVPASSYFAMGDNRDNSLDSRVWGFIPRDKLKGRAFAVFWSMRFENLIPHVNLGRTGQKL